MLQDSADKGKVKGAQPFLGDESIGETQKRTVSTKKTKINQLKWFKHHDMGRAFGLQ